MSVRRTPVSLRVRPWFADHCVEGTVVLPAVESMILLAGVTADLHPEIDIRIMEDVRFSKFLEIPPGKTRLEVLVEDECRENGSILARLLTRVQYRTMTRLKEHGEIVFPVRAQGQPRAGTLSPPASVPEKEISADRVYGELVPFGPAYHTLRGKLSFTGRYASGKLLAPAAHAADGAGTTVGSPFPLDGAFHAACVLGQRYADFVPFPVGLARRVITRSTLPGGSYIARVQLTSLSPDELVFDLDIVDEQERIFESVRGLRMRDVSGGRIRPPDWIHAGMSN